MATYSSVNRLIGGIYRNVDILSSTFGAGGFEAGSSGVVIAGGGSLTIGGKVLSSADLGLLVDGGDAGSLHNHDGQYFTETELGSNANAAGASLIGIEDANTQFTGTDVEAALDEAMDAAQAAQADATANASDVADLRTMTGTADTDTDMGTYTGTVLTDATTTKANIQELGTQVDLNVTGISDHLADATDAHDASAISSVAAGNLAATDVQSALNELDTEKLALTGGSMTGALAMGTNKITGLSDGTVSADAVNKGQLDTVEALIAGLEWQNSALDYVIDNTALPATEVTGDRYILSTTGGVPNAAWDGAAVGSIVEFDGTLWVATTPTTGMFISADDETGALYYWGGSAWTTKFFESTTASGLLTLSGLDVQFGTSTAGNMIVYSSGGVASSVAMSGEATISDTGVMTLSTSAVTGKLITGFSSGAGTVAAADSILEAIQKLDGNIIAHEGQATGAHAATAISYAGGDLSGANVELALDDAGTRILTLESEGAQAESVTESMILGEAAGTGVKMVRMAITANSETAGRVYLADPTELSATGKDPFYVIGMFVAASEAAAATVTITKYGLLTATAHGFSQGEPVFLGDAGVSSSTAPTAGGEAIVRGGIARGINEIEVQPQVVGVL